MASALLKSSNSFQALSLYRRLRRAGEESVLYSRPAIYYVRQRIREGFREYENVTDEQLLQDLFERAAERKGIEHRVIRNLCEMTYIQNRYRTRPPFVNKKQKIEKYLIHQGSYRDLYDMIKMLNDTLKLCLR
ncbi:7680_t:CDS:2 [Entrophospora sp. SA101]|nr:7680_t:CDS:2 [Entrophospora sp. SA101]